MIRGFAFTIRVSVKTKYSSHHNTKQITKVNQSKSTVQGDQVAGDQYKYSIMGIKKELAEAKVPIRSGDLALIDFNNIDADENNTILITK